MLINPRKAAKWLAKVQGLCTQCLIHKVAKDRYQCQRCIDTNHKKQAKRRKTNGNKD